jgi:hypothetical protein
MENDHRQEVTEMAKDKETRPAGNQPSSEEKPDIVDAEAHGIEAPQSNAGLASGRDDEYTHRNLEEGEDDEEET